MGQAPLILARGRWKQGDQVFKDYLGFVVRERLDTSDPVSESKVLAVLHVCILSSWFAACTETVTALCTALCSAMTSKLSGV